MAEAKLNRREEIKKLISTGEFTKKEIAAEIGIKETGVSSQLTYLRWMGNFIIWDEDKNLQFTDEDGYNTWEAAKKADRKTVSVSKKTPKEQFVALSKTVVTQEKGLGKWIDKVNLLEAEPAEDDTLLPEAKAQVVLLEIKIERNQDKLAVLDFDEDAEIDESADPVEEEELL